MHTYSPKTALPTVGSSSAHAAAAIMTMRRLASLPFVALTCLATTPLVPAAPQYGWEFADEENTDTDPWTPCEKKQEPSETNPTGANLRGFCRLSCTAKWSFAPERMDCPMLPLDKLLARSHSRGLEQFQKMSQDSFSKVNSGVSQLGASDPDTA